MERRTVPSRIQADQRFDFQSITRFPENPRRDPFDGGRPIAKTMDLLDRARELSTDLKRHPIF